MVIGNILSLSIISISLGATLISRYRANKIYTVKKPSGSKK